jgi:serine/threonine protein phosphatase 1
MTEQRYYCFPDIHGCSTALNAALKFVYKQNPNGGKIIFLGDYIDRGIDNFGVLKTVMNPPEGWDFICLIGNHEEMFINSYLNKTGFYDTNAAKDIAGFKQDEFVIYDHVHQGIDKSIIEWMDKLKLVHIEDKNVFAHAFYDDTRNPDEQVPGDVVWTRMDDFMRFPNDKQKLYLTHGHTPRKNGPIKSTNRVNLDCGAVFYGRYVIGEYYKDIQGPVGFHEFYFKEHLDW